MLLMNSCPNCGQEVNRKFVENIIDEIVKKASELPETFRIEIGMGAYKDGKNDYAGKVGYVYFCNKCCNDWRIQFFSMGNNELLRNFDLNRCKIFFARK